MTAALKNAGMVRKMATELNGEWKGEEMIMAQLEDGHTNWFGERGTLRSVPKEERYGPVWRNMDFLIL